MQKPCELFGLCGVYSFKAMSEPNREMLLAERAQAGAMATLAPAWCEFIRFCTDLKHGEIERLSIQDGLPVLAEVTKRKVKFHSR
jgi:hypothetical protein